MWTVVKKETDKEASDLEGSLGFYPVLRPAKERLVLRVRASHLLTGCSRYREEKGSQEEEERRRFLSLTWTWLLLGVSRELQNIRRLETSLVATIN